MLSRSFSFIFLYKSDVYVNCFVRPKGKSVEIVCFLLFNNKKTYWKMKQQDNGWKNTL